jgi:type II secretory pathway pseudopilin PulG
VIRVSHPLPRSARGFTLAELAIAFLVISLLLGGMLMTLSAQNQTRQLAETQRTMENARDALLGFAVRFGRLPCPAVDGTTGEESRRDAANAFTCTVCAVAAPYCEGMLPAISLGIGPTDRQGYLIDAWGNRVRYAVTNWSFSGTNVANCPPNGTKDYKVCPAFTTGNAIASLGMTNAPLFAGAPMLRICDVAACSGTNFYAPAVVWSPGRSHPTLGAVSADELENLGVTAGTFVMHEERDPGHALGQFDDLVIWLSPSVLYSRLVSAGAL